MIAHWHPWWDGPEAKVLSSDGHQMCPVCRLLPPDTTSVITKCYQEGYQKVENNPFEHEFFSFYR